MNELEFYCVAALMQACVLVSAASQYGGSLVFEQVDRLADLEFPGLTRNPRLTSRAEQERLDAGVYVAVRLGCFADVPQATVSALSHVEQKHSSRARRRSS